MPNRLPVTGNTERAQPENRAFYPALDGLRAVAFLMVFFWHYMAMPWGWAGVDVFFVLSGFLITGILFDSREDRHRLRNFYVRRVLRIFPLYYGVFLALLLLYPYAHWQWSWSWLVWPAFLGNMVGFLHPWAPGSPLGLLADCALVPTGGFRYGPLLLGHFWSLCVEEQFYLLWPGMVFLVRDRRKLMWICAESVPVCLAARIVGAHLLPAWMLQQGILSHATPFRVDDLLLGGLLALMLRGPLAGALVRWARVALPVALAGLVLWAAVTPAGHLFARPYATPEGTLTWGLSVIGVLTGLVLLAAIQPGTVLCRTLSLYPLRWMGRISYGAYVFHDIPHVYYGHLANSLRVRVALLGAGLDPDRWMRRDWLVALVALFGTLLLAWLSFRFYESLFLNLKERWTIRGKNLRIEGASHAG